MSAKTIFRTASLLFAAHILSAIPLFAQAKVFTVRKEDSHIGFAVYKWLVFKEEGRFKEFDGTIVYDRQNPSAGQVEFTVQANSIDSRNEDRDRALRSKEFFHVEKYPTLSFKSTDVTARGADSLLVTGDLTMRGVTKQITISVKVLGFHRVRDLGELAGFEATFVVNREDFGVGRGREIISKEATVHLMIGAASNGQRSASL
jgi:polyisoprenoid-binding protein YceI